MTCSSLQKTKKHGIHYPKVSSWNINDHHCKTLIIYDKSREREFHIVIKSLVFSIQCKCKQFLKTILYSLNQLICQFDKLVLFMIQTSFFFSNDPTICSHKDLFDIFRTDVLFTSNDQLCILRQQWDFVQNRASYICFEKIFCLTKILFGIVLSVCIINLSKFGPCFL